MPIRKRRTTKLKKTEIVWVSLTLLLISILGYSSQLCIMLPYYRKTPSFELKGLLAVLVPFNLGLFAIFYNYALCVWTDPGGVPAGWEPEWQALDPVTTSQYQSNHGQPLLQQQQESAGKINTNTDSTFTTTSASGATSLEMRREMQAMNQTTIESWEKDRVAIMIRRGRIRKVKYPYNLGMWSNVKSVFESMHAVVQHNSYDDGDEEAEEDETYVDSELEANILTKLMGIMIILN
uniref:Related to PFA4-Palmitoyltransferase n=1 Tax=Melanopsichium pennsylvanicum 4 TaxID=1398559 RepID=A0A077QSD8_9BASI|nr:related to PFA4-Palmitoyltransferase [Melanopsichium pennsylvanicum 4]